MKYIEERSSAINPLEDYKNLLKTNKKLRIKLGVDPTAPDVTSSVAPPVVELPPV